jgi:hypothetical protein
MPKIAHKFHGAQAYLDHGVEVYEERFFQRRLMACHEMAKSLGFMLAQKELAPSQWGKSQTRNEGEKREEPIETWASGGARKSIDPNGIRTRVCRMKTYYPRPLDDGVVFGTTW